MLKRSQRLNSAAFAKAYERSRQYRHPLLRLRVHYGGEQGVQRAAFVVPKKLGIAVRRNRLRRQLRECYRRCLSEIPQSGRAIDFIFMATPEALEAEYAELRAATAQLLHRASEGPTTS